MSLKLVILASSVFMALKSRRGPPEINDETWAKLMQVYKGNPRHIDPFTGEIFLSISHMHFTNENMSIRWTC